MVRMLTGARSVTVKFKSYTEFLNGLCVASRSGESKRQATQQGMIRGVCSENAISITTDLSLWRSRYRVSLINEN